MSVIIENKRNINYIKILPAQVQQKLLWTILEKVFITKKRTQCKPSYMLKTDVFELSNNKDIGKLFSKYVFLDQANFSFNPSQILILQYPILWASLPPFPFLLNCTMANWNPSPTQSSSCSSSVSLFCPIAFDHTPQLLDIPSHMPSQANQIYYQDIGQIRYPPKSWVFKSRFSFKVRQYGHQHSDFNTKCPESSTKWHVLFHFHNPTCVYSQPPLQSPPKIFFS